MVCRLEVLSVSQAFLSITFQKTNLRVSAQLKFQLDRLLQAFESPLALFRLQLGDCDKLVNSFLRAAELQLLRIIVFIFDIDIAGVFIFVFFILEIVSASPLLTSMRSTVASLKAHCSSSDSCMKSSSSDMLQRVM